MLDRTTRVGDEEDHFGLGEAGFMSAEDEDHFFLGEEEATDHFGLADGYSDSFDFEGLGEAWGEAGDAYAFEADGDEFLGSIWKAAKKAASVVAPIAKKFAPQIGTVIGGALGGPAGAAIGGKLGGFVKQMEADEAGDTEDEMNASLTVPATEDQLAESVAVAATKGRAADAQSMGSLITIFVGQGAPLPVKTVLPVLSQASGNVARVLSQSGDPRARVLIRTLPEIQRRTVATLTTKARAGKPVTPRVAVRVMAKHANRTLNNPAAISRALATGAAKKRALDRKAIRAAERMY